MNSDRMAKIFQRLIYDVLSYKQFPVCLVLTFCFVLILCFHDYKFGEDQCFCSPAEFIGVVDLLMCRRYCSYLPIDAVYTWVNGSDPRFLRELNNVILTMQKDQLAGVSKACDLSECIPANFIIALPSLPLGINKGKLPRNLQSRVLSVSDNLIQLRSSDDAEDSLRIQKTLHVDGEHISLFQAYWIAGNGICPSEYAIISGRSSLVTVEELAGTLNVTKVDDVVYYADSKVNLIHFLSTDEGYDFLNKPINLLGDGVEVHRACLSMHPTSADFTSEVGSNRFGDNQELRYSLRSLEKFAPWIRHVYLVTNGQIPDWLAMDSPRLTVVTHAELFPNASHLPTFSSPAIEMHLHRIAGLSPRFLYLNDDVMLGRPVWPSDFIGEAGEFRVHLSWAVPDCADGCPGSWLADGHCDLACDSSVCDWDAGDCPVGGANHSEYNVTGGSFDSRYGYAAGEFSKTGPDFLRRELGGSEDQCAPGCPDWWLADKSCDSACNVRSCGFDMSDCGPGKLQELYWASLPKPNNVVHLPPEELAVVWNITADMMNFTEVGVWHPPRKDIRNLIYNSTESVLILLRKNNASFFTTPIFLSGKLNAVEKELEFRVAVERDNFISPLKNSIYVTSGSKSPKPGLHAHVKGRVGIHESKEKTYKVADSLNKSPISNKYDNFAVIKRINDSIELDKGNPIPPVVSRHPQINGGMIQSDIGQKARVIHSVMDKSLANKSNPVDIENRNLSVGDHRGIPASSERRLSEDREAWVDAGPGRIVGPSRRLMDAFRESLQHVDRLYDHYYGQKQRNVIAHMPHLLDVEIVTELQDRFADDFVRTSAARVRSSSDMQFAFSYFYFLMSEVESVGVRQIFDQFDTDGSGTWSDREIRTLQTRLFALPLTVENLQKISAILQRCAELVPPRADEMTASVGERYLGSENPPVVTRRMAIECPQLSTLLSSKLGTRSRFEHSTVTDSGVQFIMLRDDVDSVIGHMDSVRSSPGKFICLNDNLGSTASRREIRLVRALVLDALQSLWPLPSQFELPATLRNRFSHVAEVRSWHRFEQRFRGFTLVMISLLLLCIVWPHVDAVLRRCWRWMFSARHRSRSKRRQLQRDV